MPTVSKGNSGKDQASVQEKSIAQLREGYPKYSKMSVHWDLKVKLCVYLNMYIYICVCVTYMIV